ncbi:adenosine deaminase [Brachybacterium phenoliresistens]|uniref:adenosine deaminase n=1 Tax=Brachybacterium phenoliresistens TaxID=396014 RepID=Z9JU40_9MICO|nr:adenosine deaminase [Brachybacterium phenoliresistens]
MPKVVLHDHLDGGLRPQTVLDLCREQGILPPSADAPDRSAPAAGSAAGGGEAEGPADAVARWFAESADSGSLERYLATFSRTLELMQTAPALRRIAREFVEDMVADGVVYAETRWAPMQHLAGGLTLAEAVDAVQAGLEEGMAAARAAGRPLLVGQLLCFLRHLPADPELVDVAAARREQGVWGVDLAGPELGFPAAPFREQFARARETGLRVTVHAGEADGLASIRDALDSGAERLGHGVRLAEDLSAEGRPGPIASRVREDGICLEVCPSSNLQTGAAQTMAAHPADALLRAGIPLSISSDNRLMSRTCTSRELARLAEAFDWSLEDVRRTVLTGLDAGFGPEAARRALREDVVLPAFAAAQPGRGGQE